jgi:CubicO group peptidase (beta-lactamase class C family)
MKMIMKKPFAVLYVLLVLLPGLNAQKEIIIDSTATDKIIKRFQDSLNIPGIAAGIAVNDEIIYTGISGFANVETKTVLTTDAIWHICSVSKQFSTVACLKLAEEGRLSLDDRISEYIADLPEEYPDITVRELLSHTSGIKDYLNEKNLFGMPWDKVKSEIISDTLNFNPGTSWSYSNTGFWLAARIIESVTQMDYNSYLEENFFKPLMMDRTQRISSTGIVGQRVSGYLLKSGVLTRSVRNGEFSGKGDGDLMSALPDLLRWNIALTRGNIIQKESLAKLWTPSRLNNGKEVEIAPGSGINYGLGWFIRYINGEKIVWTPGSGFGFSISSLTIPRYNLTVIVMCNLDQFLMADDISQAIAANLLR